MAIHVDIYRGRSTGPYARACATLDLPTLEDRRVQLCLNFARKDLRSQDFQHWLPPMRGTTTERTTRSTKSLPSEEQRLNDEQGASPDIEESKVLLEELEELLDEELMTNDNGGEDEIALLPEEKHFVPTDDCLLKTTDTAYRYRWDVPQLTGTRFTFQASARNDVHVGLSSVHHDVSDMYEIVIGGWRNTRSAIRRRKQGPNLAFVSTPGINSPTELRTFWINCAPDGTISVGKGDDAQPFMSWRDPNPLRVSYAGYSTGWGSTGRWKFCSIRDDCLLKTTDTTYRYRWDVPQLTGTRFTFQASARNDVHVGLSSVHHDVSDMYEIVIGGWRNTRSAIRRRKQGPNLAFVSTPGINSPTELRTFWINCAPDGTISVGKGDDAQPFMSWRDPNPLRVSYAGYSTGWGSTGRWKFCSIRDQRTFTDPNLASGRPTHQSSTGHEGDPARAVDGNRSPHWAHNSCTHTNEENDPWWYVDLGRYVTVDHVTIVNRRDCCSERITPFDVHVGYSTDVASNPRCGGHHHFPPTESEHAVHCGGLRGRYVGIRLPGKRRILTLCEVEVYAAPNLALGKPTSQSNVAHNGVASRATDGCRDPNWGSQCCTHTPAEANPWLQVDLGTSVRVQWVVIMNRADCCRERLSPFSVHIGNNARVDQNPRCGGHHTIPAGKDKDAINCNGLTGRYVGIRLPGYGRILTVCEIEVYAGTVTKRTSEVREDPEGKDCGEHKDNESWVGDDELQNCGCDSGEEFCYKVECGQDGKLQPTKGENGMWTCQETEEENEETAREFREETIGSGMEDFKE
ncbi:hypothetical protein Bbelb_288720 [Branchiostoma belcheri]|nr:hypothetical protein Bbelb_288720 [Branchiostoma belcheri]